MKKNLLKLFLSVFLSIVFSKNLYATTYYVSASGSDLNTGTSVLSPWLSVAKINDLNIHPGDSILFEGGQTFYGHIVIDANDANDSNNIVTFSSYGTGKAIINSNDTIGFYAYNTQGFTVSNLIFEGSGMNTNTTDGIYLYVDLNGNVKFTHVSISNVEILNYGGIGLEIGAGPADNSNTGFKNVLIDSVHVHHILSNGIEVWGVFDQNHVGWSHRIVVIRNTLVDSVPGFSSSGWEGTGMVLSQVDSGLMEHCVAHDNGTGNTACGGPVGIWAWDCNNVTIQFCESYHNSSGTGCDGGGFDFDGGETNSIMQYNYSHDNDGNGFLLGQFAYARPWFNNVVRYNISENDGRTNSGGISLFKGDGTTLSGAIIYQNTIFTSPSRRNSSLTSDFNITDWIMGLDSILVYNNIFETIGNKDSVALINIPAGYDAYFAGNIYWSTGDTANIIYHDTAYTDLPSWRTATGNETVNTAATGIFTDPLLTSAGNGGTMYPNAPNQLNAYKLPSNSPAVNSGLNLAALFGINAGGRDFFGNPAPVSTPDIGAYESSFIASVKAENEKYEIHCYPNPVSGKLYIALPQSEGPSYSIHIIDMKGSEVITPVASSLNNIAAIDVSKLAGGIYTVKVISGQGIQWAKMVKE